MSLPSESTGLPALVIGATAEAAAVQRYLAREALPSVHRLSVDQTADVLGAAGVSVVIVDIDDAHERAVDFVRHLKRDSATRLTPIVLLSDDRLKEHRLAGIEAGAEGVLPKPFDPEELLARVRVAGRVSQYVVDLDSAASIVMTVTAMIEARESSPGHCYRMANYATALGRALQLGDADLKALYRGAFLHDIGMLSIPDGILHKGGRLEPEEYEIIKSHPVIGDALCANLRTLATVRPIVRHHHERLDGSGYPDGLKGEDVPLLAQIVSIVDLYEAITMGRQYTAPRPADDALKVLQHETHVGWRRPDLVEAFSTLVRSGALEKFRGALPDAPVGLDELAHDLRHASGAAAAEAVAAAWGATQ